MSKLWSWGANTKGQLGHGFASEQISRPTCVTNPKITNFLTLKADCIFKIDGGGTQTLICVNDNSPSSTKCSTLIRIGKSQRNLHLKSGDLKEQDDNEFEPTIIFDNICIRDVACGWDFSLILSSDNKIFSWGCDNNKYGQLGREVTLSHFDQIEEIPGGLLATKISAGLRRAAAVGLDGHLYVWGDNSKSDLGVGGNSSDKVVRQPTKVIVNNHSGRFVDVKCGKSFTIALDDEGQFWGCGDNRFGQLGSSLGGGGSVKNFTKLILYNNCGNEQVKVKQFKCGWNHVLILLDDGQILSFGRNNFGQLGRRKEEPLKSYDNPLTFVVTNIPEKIISIATGSEHNLALSQSGTVYCWGWNEHESCGVESSKTSESQDSEIPRDSVTSPTRLKFPEGTGKLILISCGAGNGFAISESTL